MNPRAALIMAGGKSERMRAGGCMLHKALREVTGKNLIERNLTRLCDEGFGDIWIAVSAVEQALRQWIVGPGRDVAERRGARLRTLLEEGPLGTIGAAARLAYEIENVLVVNVDNLTDLDFRTFFRHHAESGAAMTVAVHEQPFQLPFGQITTTAGYLTSYVEKPCLFVRISSGAYVLNRRAMLRIPEADRTDVPGLVRILQESGERVACYEHHAWWIDVNDEEALKKANEHRASQSDSCCATSIGARQVNV
ncbi:MAG: sugar phosphate nucleotidyltransferase [Acidobacteriota bacterium]|nr:sugar phosphate nucleotidyltransferase [Acidobacteriota bacterium]